MLRAAFDMLVAWRAHAPRRRLALWREVRHITHTGLGVPGMSYRGVPGTPCLGVPHDTMLGVPAKVGLGVPDMTWLGAQGMIGLGATQTHVRVTRRAPTLA